MSVPRSTPMPPTARSLADLREDVEALVEDLIKDEVDHNVAAMWAGEQFNAQVLGGTNMEHAMRTDFILFETLALLTDLGPRVVPLEVKPGTFERMLKRLREPPSRTRRKESGGR